MRLLKIVGYLMAALFLLSAAIQYNDPDSLLWIGVYGAAAVTTLCFTINRLHRSIPAVLGIVTLVWSGMLFADLLIHGSIGDVNILQMQNLTEEKIREAGGLLIVGIWSLVMTRAVREFDSGTDKQTGESGN